jgi:hypothetical protein
MLFWCVGRTECVKWMRIDEVMTFRLCSYFVLKSNIRIQIRVRVAQLVWWPVCGLAGAGLGLGPARRVPAVNRTEREADHSPLYSAEVKKLWELTPLPQYVFMAWFLIKRWIQGKLYLYIWRIIYFLFKMSAVKGLVITRPTQNHVIWYWSTHV